MNDQDLELERLRSAFAARVDVAGTGAECPPADRLWSAVQGQLGPDEVRPLVAHIAACGACAESWRLARELGADDAAVQLAARRPVAARGRFTAWAAGIAATIALAAVFVQRPAPSDFREGAGAAIRSLVPESRALSRHRLLLRWDGAPPGSSYAVQVATDGLEPVADARGLSAPEYLVPPERLASLPAGTKLLWRVEAVAPGGARLVSGTFVSRLE
jgi:hypothetical protein